MNYKKTKEQCPNLGKYYLSTTGGLFVLTRLVLEITDIKKLVQHSQILPQSVFKLLFVCTSESIAHKKVY